MDIKILRNNKDDGYARISIDGKVDEGSTVLGKTVTIDTDESFTKFKNFTDDALSKLFYSITYKLKEEWCEFPLSIEILPSSKDFPEEMDNQPRIWIMPLINYLEWKNLYAPLDLADKYEEISKTIHGVTFGHVNTMSIEDGFGIKITIKKTDVPIKQYIDFAIESLKTIHVFAIEALNNQVSTERITSLFEFPPEIKSACSQYLMYFGQFLEDLGIDANLNLKEEANRVLFTITPNNKNQALNVINNALTTYLNTPNQYLQFDNNDNENEIAILQWKSNILHLRSQIELSKAIIQAKDAQIEALELSKYQLQTLALSNTHTTKIDDENILGGIVTITKIEAKGFTINLSEIYRKLKRRFKKH